MNDKNSLIFTKEQIPKEYIHLKDNTEIQNTFIHNTNYALKQQGYVDDMI